MSSSVSSSQLNTAVSLTQWDTEKDRKLAAAGSVIQYESGKDDLGRDSIYIIKRVSDAIGSGFGTASTRKIVEESFKHGFGGRIHNQASWSSHIFHLYMGMIPHDCQINFIRHQWGVFGEGARKNLFKIQKKLQSKAPLSSKEQDDLKILKGMLAYIKGVRKKEVTDQDVVECTDKISALNSKTVPYLKCDFIPHLLEIFEKDPTKRHPDTEYLMSVNMMMSDEGIACWKEAIENKQAFKPFKKLEHLRPYMSSEQLSRLDRIMAIREKALQPTKEEAKEEKSPM